MLPIIAASTVQFRRGGLLVGVLSAVLYAALVLAQYQAAAGCRAVAGSRRRAAAACASRIYTVGLNVFGFFAVAVAERLAGRRPAAAGAQLERRVARRSPTCRRSTSTSSTA